LKGAKIIQLFSNRDKPEPMDQGKHGKNWVLLVISPWDWRSSLKFYTMQFVPVKMLSAHSCCSFWKNVMLQCNVINQIINRPQYQHKLVVNTIPKR